MFACGIEGLAQIFCNNSNSERYARVRHYLKQMDGKPTYLYHKLENLAEIEELLRAKDLLSQVQQHESGQASSSIDQNSNISSPNQFSKHQKGWSSSLVRTLALRAKGRRFKSGPAHSSSFFKVEMKLFVELLVEICVIRFFKWFSNVLLRLKPRDFDFSTSFLSKYNTTLPFIVIAYASEGVHWQVLCYMFGPLVAHQFPKLLISNLRQIKRNSKFPNFFKEKMRLAFCSRCFYAFQLQVF